MMNKKHQIIERVTITGKREERSTAIEYCDQYGYDVVHSGPRWKGPGMADFTRFKIMAEKEVRADVK